MKRVLLMTVAGTLVASSAMADMVNARFALHAKASFVAGKVVGSRCDSPGTTTIEPNYSPNWNSTTSVANPLPCTGYNTAVPTFPNTGSPPGYSDVYVVVGRAGSEGIAGVSFGVNYTQFVDPGFLQFNLCANGLYFPNGPQGAPEFPADNGGVRITWLLPEGCQQQQVGGFGVHAVVGAFNVYWYDGNVMSLTPNNNLQSGLPELAITNCGGITTELTEVWPTEIINLIVGSVGFGSAAGYNPCLVIPTKETTWGRIKTQYND